VAACERIRFEAAEQSKRVAAEIGDAIAGKTERIQVLETPRYLYDDLAPRLPSMARHTAYVKIAEGCDRPCAFCIIPKLRGPQRSRLPSSVRREIEALAAAGTREVCLVAQDLTTYGTDLDDGGAAGDRRPTLASLLDDIAGVEKIRWLRLHYAYPTVCGDDLLDVIASRSRVAKYLDVPVQHVDSEVLKKMRRGYGERVVRDLVDRVRTRIPGVTLRTTFIVGHPGETDAAFLRLCDFVREAQVDRVGVFSYSQEEGTVAALLPGRVPQKEVEARRRELLRIQRGISKTKLRALRGREIEVLVEGPSDESEYLLMGRHEGQAPEIDGQVYLSFADTAADAPAQEVAMGFTGRPRAYLDPGAWATVQLDPSTTSPPPATGRLTGCPRS
jgi:ribosomal protein S12 methylthiotransferase